MLAMQAAGYALRVSCVTPGLGPALGMAGVGVASALAGEASRRLGSHLRGQPLPQRRRMHQAAADAALDAAIGIALFKAIPLNTRQATQHAWSQTGIHVSLTPGLVSRAGSSNRRRPAACAEDGMALGGCS